MRKALPLAVLLGVSGRSSMEGKGEFEDGTRNCRGRRLGAQEDTAWGVKAIISIFSPFSHWLNSIPWPSQSRKRRRSFSESGLFAKRTKIQITHEGF